MKTTYAAPKVIIYWTRSYELLLHIYDNAKIYEDLSWDSLSLKNAYERRIDFIRIGSFSATHSLASCIPVLACIFIWSSNRIQ